MKKHRLVNLIQLCLCCAFSPLLRAAEPAQNQLNAFEMHIYQYLRQCIDGHQAVPTMEQMESLPGGALSPEARARLSSRLYHEHGIIGAMLTEEEYRIVDYLFHQRGELGRAHDLALHIRSALGGDTTILRILDALSFLRNAGYVDIRHNDQTVYLIIPRGQAILQRAMHLEMDGGGPFIPAPPDRWPDLPREEPAATITDTAIVATLRQPVSAAPMAGPDASRTCADRRGVAETRNQRQAPSPEQERSRPDPLSLSGAAVSVRNCSPSPSTSRESGHEYGSSCDSRNGGERRRQSGAPDQQAWPFLFGQSTYDLRVITSDTYEDVYLNVKDGRLTSCLPPNVIVFNCREPGHIYFFRTMENCRLWRDDHPHIKGQVMSLPETLSWARNLVRGQ